MIRLEAAALAVGGQTVLHDIDLTFRPGALVALCGPNGAGKSTLLRALAGLLPGQTPADPRHAAYLPQGVRSAWGLTVAQVAELGRIPHGDRDGAAVERALVACGVAHLRHARIDRISGGEARRAMLARVLATEPGVLLLDEPTADLDPAAQHQVMALLRGLAAGGIVAVVLHALDLVQHYADRVLVLEAGRIVADAPPHAAMPRAAAAFGMAWGSDPAPRLLPR